MLERSKTASVTGTLIIPNTSAVGLVRFSNLTTGVVGIPAGTIVRTTVSPPVRFATTMDAVVAAGVGKTMDVPVQAVEAGSSGNLPADSLVAFEGDLGTSLSGTNPSPTTGGSDRSAPVQTADDRIRLRAALVSEILNQCKTSLPKSIGQGDTYFPDTLAVGQVLSETYFPADGQTGQTLSLTMNLQCQAQYASQADVNSLGRLALDANLPAGFGPCHSGGFNAQFERSCYRLRWDHTLAGTGSASPAGPARSDGGHAIDPGSQPLKWPVGGWLHHSGWLARP